MAAPIILPRTMDELLDERRDAAKLAGRAFKSRRLGAEGFSAQFDWMMRLNALIARRASA